MEPRTIFFLVVVYFGSVAFGDLNGHQPGYCFAYGSCGPNYNLTNAEIRGDMACLNYRKAEYLRPGSSHYRNLKNTCPMLIAKAGEETYACCDEDQIRTLDVQLSASKLLFNRCPSCVENFVTFYCEITCSPNNSMFVNVTEVTTINQSPELPLPGIAEQEVYLTEKLATALHGSCKDVVFPQTNDKAITLVCNGKSGDACQPQDFLEYLGSTNNGVAPVDMVFYQIGNDSSNKDVFPSAPEGMEPMDPKAYRCDEIPYTNSSVCSCTDCELTCPAPPPHKEPPPPFEIGNEDGVAVIMLIIFCSLVLSFLLFLLCSYLRRGKSDATDTVVDKETEAWYESASFSSEKASHHESDSSSIVEKSDISAFQKFGKISQDAFRKAFQKWGTFVARYPLIVAIPSLLAIVALSVGTKFIILTTDPIELWTAPSSRVRIEKDYYDSHFGPFYRTEMVIMTLKPEYQSSGSLYNSYNGLQYNFSEILDKKYLVATLELQNKLRYMTVTYEDDGETKNGTLNDICFKPLAPDNNNCTITSVMNFWQNDPNELDKVVENYTDKITGEQYRVDYRDHFIYCVQAPATIQDTTPLVQNCMGDYGGPIFPFLVVGGQGEDAPYNEASAMILTFVVNNLPKDDPRIKLIKAWEQAFLEVMANWNSEYFDLAYFSERSPEDELTRSSQNDLVVFIISYVVIFVYITVALGTYTSFRRIPVDSKISLGLVGIVVILGSVFASVGFLGYIGYATSLIVIEVVPFLVLAIGADNVFILTLEYQRDQKRSGESLPEQIGRVFGDVAPSMLLCSATECVTFFLGMLTQMPAVKQFALAAALAILFDFLLQITVFLAVLSLDARRQEQNRMDCLCCFQLKESDEPNKSYLQIFFHKYYAPFLMNDLVRALVMIAFTGLCCWCIILTSNMKVGLDQDLSVPKDSYVLDYFDKMEKYLDVGVPVYFVTKNPYNFSDPNAGNQICGFAGCDTYSLTQQITFASQNPDYWKIETPAASWYDDYIDWLSPMGQKSCCRYHLDTKEFCPATDTNSTDCIPCVAGRKGYNSEQFMEYLPWFLKDNPGLECNKGGHSAYGNAVNITTNYNNAGQDVVEASYFMAYHSVCIKSVDCTENLVKARELADNITASLKTANTDANGYVIGNPEDFEVFPYCLYYVYYEQYLTIVEDSLFLVGICLIPTFAFSFILLGFDLFSGLVTVITIMMIIVDTAGLSSLWGVDLNAVSLINFVQAIGLSVEFISHVVHTFSLTTSKTRKKRVIEAMATMGPAVFAGVALTNLPGIIVLNWATAQLITVFFFRMCLIITLLGTVHGLIFLPVFLSYFGPPVNKALLYEKQQKEANSSAQEVYANMAFEKVTTEL